MLSALRHPNYRWYYVSGLGMAASLFMQQLALSWLVLDLTGSIGQLGLVIFVQGLPMAIISLFGGVLADRYSRRYLLMAAQLMTMVNLLVLSALTLTGLVQVWQVYISSMLLGAGQALTIPARNAYISALVGPEDIMNAVALNTTQQQSSRIVWPSFAGVLISFAGVGPTLVVCAIASLVGVVCLMFIQGVTEKVQTIRTESVQAEVIEGFRYSLSNPRVAVVVLMGWAMGVFGLGFQQLAPGFAREEMGFSASQAGFFVMSAGIGAIIGSIVLIMVHLKDHHRTFLIASAGFGGSLVLICLNPWFLPSFFFMGLYGFFQASYQVNAQTIFQLNVPSHLLGRVIGLWSFAGGLGAISALPIGVAGELIGLRLALIIDAALLVVAALLVSVLIPSHRRNAY